MTFASQIALTATPLSAYFYALGLLHGGRTPKVVGGPADVALLGVGVGGLVAFGPLGQAILGLVVGREAGPWDWLAFSAVLGVALCFVARSATRRLAIYNVTPEGLELAVVESLGGLEGRFDVTLRGFEDARRGSGVTVRASRWLRAGSVEAYGQEPEKLMAELKPRLKARLAEVIRAPSLVSSAMFGVACLVMLVPAASFFARNPKAKEALRALLQSLKWW